MIALRNKSTRIRSFVKIGGNLITVPKAKEEGKGELVPVCEDGEMAIVQDAIKNIPNVEIVHVQKDSPMLDQLKATAKGREVQMWMEKPESELRKELERRKIEAPKEAKKEDLVALLTK